ncbi:VCBS repeat-containing protein, partial [Sinorhizobium kostiense]
MATQTTGGGSTTSFNNTQAQDDVYGWTEEQLLASSIYDAATHTITLDVTSNDLGGKAKTLWSIDDGGTNLMSELLKSNTTTNWEKTAEGNWIRVCNGKIEYRIESGSNSPDSARSIDSLTGDDHIQDSFYYSIRLSNGTLSYAKVTVDIVGQNDAAAIGGTSTASVIEAGGAGNGDPGAPTASGTLQVDDVDAGEKHFKSPTESALNGAYGSFAFNQLTGQWSYTLDNDRSATQALTAGQVVTETLTVWSADGTASRDIVVTITGSNDAPVVSGAVTGKATEDGTAVTLVALANASDVDDATTLEVVGVPALPAGVSYDPATQAFTLDPTDAAYQHLAAGQSTVVTVSYGVSDGIATTPASVSWTVTGTNDAPVVNGAVTGEATEDGTAVTLQAIANASDVDDATTLQVVGVPALPAGVSYDPATQAFTLDPTDAAYQHLAAGQTTVVTVSYGVSDGIATTPASVSWTVTGTNDAPVVNGAVTGEATEDGTAVTLDARDNTTDVDDATTLEVVGVPALPAGVSYDLATQTFTLDPTDAAYQHLAAGQSTVVTVNYGVSDGVATTPASVSWTVTGSNDNPTTGAVTLAAVAEDSGARLITQAELLANAADVDGDSLTASDLEIAVGNGALVDNGNGTWTFTPAA